MLFKRKTLTEIAEGRVTVAFRLWKRPTVKLGGTLKTAVGVLSIEGLDEIDPDSITKADAKRAGYASPKDVLHALGDRDGALYRIRFELAGEDPRIALRESDQLSKEEFAEITAKLDRLDAASKFGPWTRAVLEIIEKHPETSAVELAAMLGFERSWLKPNIRKLKGRGLTISFNPGYRLSPRGVVVLKHLKSRR